MKCYAGYVVPQPLIGHARRTMSLRATVVIVAAVFSLAASSEPVIPIGSGTYEFELRDAEFPHIRGVAVRVVVHGRRVKVTSSDPKSKLFPIGTTVDEGLLSWNRHARRWIIGRDDSDRDSKAADVCDGGPPWVDFASRIIWGCESS
jgi:hypothetical protein